MLDLAASVGLLLALTAPCVAVVLAWSRSRRLAPALLFLAVLALDSAVVSAPVVLQAGLIPGARWNWTGKALSVAVALAFFAFSRLSRDEVGLTLRQTPGSARPAALATAALIGLGAAIALVLGGDAPTAETVAYQVTMPGLSEELVFRGVLFALLVRAVRPDSESTVAALWGPAVVTTVAFAWIHTPSVVDGGVRFEPLAFLLPLVAGAAFAWLRVRTGSLAWPILAHNGLNTALVVCAGL